MMIQYLTITFLVLNFFAALPLWQIIFKHISKKPLLSVTLVDLIYKDMTIYTNLLCLFVSAGIIHTLMYDDESLILSHELALYYSICINFASNSICISLIVSAGLRLISLIKTSEAAGEKRIELRKRGIIIFLQGAMLDKFVTIPASIVSLNASN